MDYVTGALGSLEDCYGGRVLGGDDIELLRVPTEMYESFEEKEWNRVSVCSNEPRC